MTERPEDVCLRCTRPAKECQGGDRDCDFMRLYPHKRDWSTSVRQDWCGVREQTERGVTCR